jgi:secondary thiamine-phosphate synthase enzyme
MIAFEVSSRQRCQMIDIGAQVRQAICELGVDTGIALVFTPHTSAALTINENADPDVVRDLLRRLEELAPAGGDDLHAEGNSDAHLKSSLVGTSVQLIIQGGQPLLGTWQGIWFCEFDGPRRRKVQVQAVGR